VDSSFFHSFLNVLEMASHLNFEVLLGVADVDLVRHLAGRLILYDDRHSA
jgi:hypothetical protein